MAKTTFSALSASRPPQHAAAEELWTLASWYREFAERAGSPAIWEARLRTAEQLEAEADRITALSSPILPGNDDSAAWHAGGNWRHRWGQFAAELRAEARRLTTTADRISDRLHNRSDALRALAMAQRAELVARCLDHPELVESNIRRWTDVQSGGLSDAAHRALLEQCLGDARALLSDLHRAVPGG